MRSLFEKPTVSHIQKIRAAHLNHSLNQNKAITNVKLGGITAWLVVLVSALFFFYEFLQMNMFNTINNDLVRTFNIDGVQLGNLSAAYFYADIVLLLPAGIILDKFSTRIILSTAMTITVLAMLVFSFTDHYWVAFAMRLLSGFGAAFNLLSSLRLASRWFPASHLALITGIVVTMAMLGGLLAQTPMALLVAQIGWRHAILVDVGIGALFLILIISIVRDHPKGYLQADLEKPNKMNLSKTIFYVLQNRQNWLAGIYTSLLNLPILVLGALWGTQYLMQVNNFSHTQAANINSMLFIGAIIGAPIAGWLSDAVKNRKKPMIIGALLSLIIILSIRYLHSSTYPTMLILFLALGIFTSAQIISYPIITESNPLALTGTALGLASVLIMSGGAIFQPLMGWLLDLHWDSTKINGAPFYSTHDYHFAFMIFPLMFIISLLLSFLIRETNAIEEH